ncbi:MAG TPA: M1 family aminopeptidase, partial [Thermoanaerobaculia bacterium]
MKNSITILILTLLALPAPAQRLPRTVIPAHYELTFRPDFKSETFAGEETIHVSVQQPTKEVVLHAVEIEFHDVAIESEGKSQKATMTPEPQNEWVRLSVAEPVSIGPATIRIRYTGLLNRKLRGLYLGEANGRKYASTQMEATDARAAFPSFDEPEMKATFAITTIVDQGDSVIANSAELSDAPGPTEGMHTIRFATTPRMSTYLVALTIGNIKCLKDEIDGIPLRICGTPEKLPFGAYAMDATKSILNYFNEYYGIRYPFGKLDQTGVADFRAGAMENTGAILYRDAILFLDPDTAPAYEKRGTASTISHEIAHMWFGDLVTMRWWDDIWLNEGFASWITSKPLAAWKPEWKMPLREAGNAGALNADALRTSRPIRQQAETPDEIDELFDGIAYGKTAAVLAMLESYMGEENFRKGVNDYLASRAYGNATFYDFADSLRTASDAPVMEILKAFVEQPGVPLIRATSECRDGESWIALEQERFFLDPTPGPPNVQTWTIPVCFTRNGTQRCELLTQKKQTIRVPGCRGLYLNARGRGYYLTQHSGPMLDAILTARSTFDPTERMSLVRDEWNLVRSAQRPVGDFLRL